MWAPPPMEVFRVYYYCQFWLFAIGTVHSIDIWIVYYKRTQQVMYNSPKYFVSGVLLDLQSLRNVYLCIVGYPISFPAKQQNGTHGISRS